MATGKNGCTGTAHGGGPCNAHPIRGTDRCKRCCGVPIAKQRAKGAIVVELRSWGLNGHTELADPGQTLLKLITQSAARAEHYAALLEQAYDAAERLRDSTNPPTADDVPGVASNHVDRERAAEDLDRIFTTGGVAALVGYKYAAAGKDGHLFVAEEAIRGLVQLEAQERDRCANFAVKGIAAGLAERQVRLAERQGALVADVLRGVLADLGHDPGSPEVLRVMSARLAELGGAA